MTPFNWDKATLLLDAIGETGYSVRAACGSPGVEISYRDVRRWADENADFRHLIEIAVERRNYYLERTFASKDVMPQYKLLLARMLAVSNPEAWGVGGTPLLTPAAREERKVVFKVVEKGEGEPRRGISLVGGSEDRAGENGPVGGPQAA